MLTSPPISQLRFRSILISVGLGAALIAGWLSFLGWSAGTGMASRPVEIRARLLPASAAYPSAPYLVKDINQVRQSSNPRTLFPVDGRLFFVAVIDYSGYELFASDGTQAGTGIVRDISPGYYDGIPDVNDATQMADVGGLLFFSASNGSARNGEELWKSDGTFTGTLQVKDIYPGAGSSSPHFLIEMNGALYFSAVDGSTGGELWKSDGTPQGTLQVTDIRPGSGSAGISSLAEISGTLFFPADDGSSGQELWKSDGTLTGTLQVMDICPGSCPASPTQFTPAGGLLYFLANDGVHGRELWRSDSTPAGTFLVRDIVSGTASSSPSFLTAMNGALFFQANDGVSGSELWKSDGTYTGTVRVKDINPGSASSSPSFPAPLGNVLFFTAIDNSLGAELWKSDGTETGTVLVKDINPGSGSSAPAPMKALNDLLLFRANDGASGMELWRSDGTQAGTFQVKDIAPGSPSSLVSSPSIYLVEMEGSVFFNADDGVHGVELWKTDGTQAGTHLVKDLAVSLGSGPGNLAHVGNRLFFRADDGASGAELWASDGTPQSTLLVKDIRPGKDTSSPSNLVGVGDRLFFSAQDSSNGIELWASGGTPENTLLVKDIRPGSSSSSPSNLTSVNELLFFSADDGTSGAELWKSDGTLTGTVRVRDIRPGSNPSYPGALLGIDGVLFFAANDGSHGSELWKSDGVYTGTVMVKDICPGSCSSTPANLARVGSTLFFSVRNGSLDELWKSNGTPEGTLLVRGGYALDISGRGLRYPAGVGNVLYFVAYSSPGHYDLWKSDGTEAGTQIVKDFNPSGSANQWNLADIDGALFFLAEDSLGQALWKSDGTEAGTIRLKGFERLDNFTPYFLMGAGGLAFFGAPCPDGNGYELWRSDGTPQGTLPAGDIYPGGGIAIPAGLTQAGGRLFFGSTDGSHSAELWALDLTSLSPEANDDLAETQEDSPIDIYPLGNDRDPFGDPIALLAVGQPLHGSAVASGSLVTYMPGLDFNGADVFTYTVTDGSLAGTAFVRVTVHPVNDPPRVEAGPDLVGFERMGIAFHGIVTDVDSPQVAISWDFGDGTKIAGTLDPLHVYQQAGAFTVTLHAEDGDGGQAADWLQVIVNTSSWRIYLPGLFH